VATVWTVGLLDLQVGPGDLPSSPIINNAYLHHEEKEKGSLEVGKLGDVIVIDRDILTCPLGEVAGTRVLYTVVGVQVVYQRK
jgi:predicted amidohydrolase YtcJ